MSYTQGQIDVKDANGVSQPVDAAIVSNTGSPPSTNQAARQIMAIGDPSTPGNVASINANQQLSIAVTKFNNIETTTPLAGSATFTGSWHDASVDGTTWITITSLADQSASSLFVDQTNDTGNSNLFFYVQPATPQGNALLVTTVPIFARYYRIRYNNLSTAQTSFELAFSTGQGPMPFRGAFNQGFGGVNKTATSINNNGAVIIAPANDASNNPFPVSQSGNWGNSLTKGTQSLTGWSVQQLKDSGRTQIYIGATQVTGTTSESVITCNITKGQSAQTAASTYTVTAGKTLRIQSIRYGVSGATGVATIRLRLTSVTGAPIWEDSLVYGATTANQASELQQFPDGLELSAGTVINWTMVCASTSQKVDVALCGYEY